MSRIVPALALLAAVWFAAPKQLTDPDTLSRLANGRAIVVERGVFERDPFTFARPDASLGQTEWLGDVIVFAVYSHAGERALQYFAISLVALGFVLALSCGVRLSAPAGVMLVLLSLMLPASAVRFAARNDIHALWLSPLFALVLLSCGQRTRAWLTLLGLGALWANLHASFVLGFVLLAGAALECRLRDGALRRVPMAVLLVYPALPLLGPGGGSAYAQLVDHALGAASYRNVISEWQSPLTSTGVLAHLPLYVLSVLGVGALANTRPRPRLLVVVMFLLGTVLALGSRRFLPLFAVLAVPAFAGSAWEWFARRGPIFRGTAGVTASAVCCAYLVLGARSVLLRTDEPVLARSDGPRDAAQFIAARAPSGARLFNAFNDGPWLLWLTAPRVQHYVDPRNHLGAGFLSHYVQDLLPNPRRFEREVERLRITLALVRTADPAMRALAAHLTASPHWHLVYWAPRHALHARTVDENRALIDRGYRVLRPTFDLSYLKNSDAPALADDLKLLTSQSATLASALRASLLLLRAGSELDRESSLRAASALRTAMLSLPPSPHLVLYLALALQRAGQPQAAGIVLQNAAPLFPELRGLNLRP